jgi:hypothetical protein
MKISFVMLVLAVLACNMHAQDMHAPEASAEFAVQSALAVHPFIAREDLRRSRFWTRSTIALVTFDGVAKATDSFATRKNIDGGGEEYNPLARPFVHTAGVQVVSTLALFGAEIAMAYVLHQRHHDNAGRALLVGGAVMNSLGAATSFKHRVAGW